MPRRGPHTTLPVPLQPQGALAMASAVFATASSIILCARSFAAHSSSLCHAIARHPVPLIRLFSERTNSRPRTPASAETRLPRNAFAAPRNRRRPPPRTKSAGSVWDPFFGAEQPPAMRQSELRA
jgi:hypothetical protein